MDTVSTEARGRTLIVTIERPQARNAVDGPTARQLYDAFKAFDADEGLDVAILQGRGGRSAQGQHRPMPPWPRPIHKRHCTARTVV